MKNYWLPIIEIKCYDQENRIYWYIAKSKNHGYGNTSYLHEDMIWRKTTLNEKDRYTGFYKTKKEAEEILKMFLDSH
jgi:hypothetical protein